MAEMEPCSFDTIRCTTSDNATVFDDVSLFVAFAPLVTTDEFVVDVETAVRIASTASLNALTRDVSPDDVVVALPVALADVVVDDDDDATSSTGLIFEDAASTGANAL